MLWVQPNLIKPPTKPNYKKIQNYVFDLNQILGAGNFSKVYRAVNQLNNQVVAIKVVELLSIKNKTLVQLLYSEIDILRTLKHQNILNCLEVFSSNNNCYIITEFCNEGDLETKIRDTGPLSQMQARKLIYQTFSGMKYLSDHQIIHRDLKVANVFMSNGAAKIADFGFVRKLKYPNEKFKDINIGSPIYMSPQGLIKNQYGPKTDVWAFGVFIFQLLHGDTPLAFCQSQSELYTHLQIPLTRNKILPNLSQQLKNLILRCLDVNEHTRISFQQMYNHPYIVYLRKTYQNLGGNIQSNQQISQIPKLKTSESTNMTQPSKSQAETQTMITQYNNMMLAQQRTGTNLSITNLQGLSALQISQQQLLNQSLNTQNIKPSTAQTEIHTQTQLPIVSQKQIKNSNSTNNLNQSEIIPSNIINTTITFPQCVQILHYCRLVYKCFCFGQKVKSCQKINPYLSNWVLSLANELQKKQTTNVSFVGQRASLRQQKLHQVITQYNSKYKSELIWIHGGIVTLPMFQPLIYQALVSLDTQIKSCRNPTDLQQLVKLSHYLFSLHQANQILIKSIQSNNFSPITEAKIEDFLNRKNQSFTLQSYGGFRNRIVT